MSAVELCTAPLARQVGEFNHQVDGLREERSTVRAAALARQAQEILRFAQDTESRNIDRALVESDFDFEAEQAELRAIRSGFAGLVLTMHEAFFELFEQDSRRELVQIAHLALRAPTVTSEGLEVIRRGMAEVLAARPH